ncbi:MAG: hypothetical protein ACK55I_37715 [bacterium]
MSMQTDSPRRQEQAAQTSPLMRRSSLSDIRYSVVNLLSFTWG